MPEAGGTATQAGIFYQNSVAALALADLLDLDQRIAREHVVEVRVEAPEDVDDVVIRFADAHREYQNIKLSIGLGNSAWSRIWQSLNAQRTSDTSRKNDQFVLVIEERSNDSESVAALCERAASSIDLQELRARLSRAQASAFDSITNILGSESASYELLRRTSIRHLSLIEINQELARRRLAGALSPSMELLPILRDIAGGEARRRGLFQPAPLRRRLKLEHGLLLGEPPEWGLESYRAMIKNLARIEVPGMGISGPAEELFVWPRARNHDRSRLTDFEDENPSFVQKSDLALDLKAFPSEQLDRVVVVAGPGYGKSALLTAIAGKLSEGPLVPVSIPLASLAATDDSLVSFLSNSISKEMDLNADWRRLAEQGLLVLLLDGLDEVPSGARPRLMQRISTFSARYPRSPWILSVRDPAVLTGLPEAKLVELLPLDDDDIQRFVEAMNRHIGPIKGWELVHRLKLYPELDRLARIPLFLVMLLVTTDLSAPQPATRSDLIESYLSTLFSPARHKPAQDPIDKSIALRSIAETLAFERLERQEIGATDREVRDVIGRTANSRAEAEQLLEQLRSNGILRPQSAIRLQFPYPIVQEYLAACHLVERYPDSLKQRIDDAMQRPWAQVIQFAIELHSSPEPIIKEMLARPDDAFCTGLRLVGRCVANGATVSKELKQEISDRLVAFWIHAHTDARRRVGRLLADGFIDLPSPALRAALHHRWLIEQGAGDIISKLNETDLTLSVLEDLMEQDRSGIMYYHSLKPALRAAGDRALNVVIKKMDPSTLGQDDLISISSLLWHFSPMEMSRETVLSVARDERLPAQARMRAYLLAGPPLEEDGIILMRSAFRHNDWDRHYAASQLIEVADEPEHLLNELLNDSNIPLDRRRNLASDVAKIFPETTARKSFSQKTISDSRFDEEVRLTLQLVEARFGERATFEQLLNGINCNPIDFAATTIALFGHYPDQSLAERAAMLVRNRDWSPQEVIRITNSIGTGMLTVFEMDYGFGGTLRPTSPHPGISAWVELLEDWAKRPDLTPRARLDVLSTASEIGSERARANLETEILAIDNMDAEDWSDEDNSGHTLSRALREMQRRKPLLPKSLIDKLVASERFNIAVKGIHAFQALGSIPALERLIELYEIKTNWHMRDTIANAIELMSARLSVTVQRADGGYQIATRA